MTTSPVFTNRRIYRNAAALVGFQSVSDVPVEDFTLARSIFMRDLIFDPQVDKPYSYGAEGKPYKRTPGRFVSSIKPVLEMRGLATPKNLETLFRSWGGTWNPIGGGQYQLALTDYLNEYATLALIENRTLPNPERVTRVWDTWLHRVTLRLTPGLSALEAEAHGIARDYDETALDDLGPLTIPSIATPGMDRAFAPHSARLFRDPSGANVSIAMESLELDFQQGFGHENWCDMAPLVRKHGYTTVSMRLRGSLSDETYAIRDEAKSVTFKRFDATFADGVKSFSVSLKNLDLTVSPIGWSGGRFVFECEGEAFMDDADAFVDLILLP